MITVQKLSIKVISQHFNRSCQDINTLTKEIKKISAYTSVVPKLVVKLENLEKKTTADIADLKARTLVNEEDIKKIFIILDKQSGKDNVAETV